MAVRSSVARVTILNGASQPAAAVDLGGKRLVAIEMPSGWTAAALTFQAGGDETSTLQDLYDGATEVSLSVAASRTVNVDPSLFAGARFLKIRSGTSAAAVNQGADRSIGLVTASVLG